MDLFVQMLERNFRFFHRRSLELRIVIVQSLTLILSTLRPVAIPRERRAFGPVLPSWNQDGIDKALGSGLIQPRNLNEQNRSRTIGLSGLQKTEAAEQRNDRGTDSAVASRVHQEEIARLGQQRVHLPR